MTAYAAPALVFAGCTWLGFALSARIKRREKAAARLEAQFTALSGYVSRLYMPLPAALRLCGDELKDAADTIESRPGLSAGEAVREAVAGGGLDERDIAEVILWINIMENMRKEDCESTMKGALEAVKNIRGKALEAQKKDSALYRALGACLGAALAVLML